MRPVCPSSPVGMNRRWWAQVWRYGYRGLGSMVKSQSSSPAFPAHGNGAGISGLGIFDDARARALWPASLRPVECTMRACAHSLSPPGRGYSSVSSVYSSRLSMYLLLYDLQALLVTYILLLLLESGRRCPRVWMFPHRRKKWKSRSLRREGGLGGW